jgi:hypothetical protein
MSTECSRHVTLSDRELLREVHRLVTCERAATVHLIAALGELDERRLYLAEGCSSLFTYCTQVLHLSEHAAYGRIEAARAARRWPVILDLLADGSLHLTAVALLQPHLTTENHRDLLATARHKSKRQIEELVAAVRPRPTVPSTVRKLPSSCRNGEAHAAGAQSKGNPDSPAEHRSEPRLHGPFRPSADIKPLAPDAYKVQFTISRDTYDKLRQIQDLLRHRIPYGDIASVFDRAITVLLTELHKAKHGLVARPLTGHARQPRGRHIPAAVKREVWTRDGGQCAYVGPRGRCTERGFVEYHHIVPFADGGATAVDNLALRCRAHNRHEADRWFGVGEEQLLDAADT